MRVYVVGYTKRDSATKVVEHYLIGLSTSESSAMSLLEQSGQEATWIALLPLDTYLPKYINEWPELKYVESE